MVLSAGSRADRRVARLWLGWAGGSLCSGGWERKEVSYKDIECKLCVGRGWCEGPSEGDFFSGSERDPPLPYTAGYELRRSHGVFPGDFQCVQEESLS